MKTAVPLPKKGQEASGLLVTIVMTALALATLAAALSWSVSTTRLNERSTQFAQSVAAAEARSEAVIGRIARDFRNGGAKLINDNRNLYAQVTFTNSKWADWEFSDAQGNAGRTFVEIGSFTNYTEINSSYTGLKAFVCNVNVVSNARLTNTLQNVVAGVGQTLQLANIPIFQFAMFSSGDMEIGCGQPFRITGRVHSNRNLYVEPVSDLTFESDVTAVLDILYARHPLDPRVPPYGSVTYMGRKESHVPALNMPIGTNNTPEAIREILQPPPDGEDENSLMGRQRYYNLADMIVAVSSTGIVATAGVPFSKASISTNFTNFITISRSFHDAREGKTVRPIDINIGGLITWSETNRSHFGGRDLKSIYVLDNRNLTTQLGAVRVHNGADLPSGGLTIATARPLYIWGNYNQPHTAHLHTTNTALTKPASLAADAITILSGNWLDLNGSALLSVRVATPTTVNAAFLTGAVDTIQDYYSGGMENFPRFLEIWGLLTPLTYNGSMVKMFPSLYATNRYGKDQVYTPPARNWAFDANFNEPGKLPPLTPCVQRVVRGQWANLAPNRTNAPTSL